jgi:predicted secreted protein
MTARESRITLRVGQDHEIRLAGLRTAGYQWSFDIEGAQEAIRVRKSWGPTPGNLVGYSADEVFTITARRPGRATVRFEQRRSWEKRSPPVHRAAIVRVRVHD